MIEFKEGVKYKNLRLELVTRLWHIENIVHYWAGDHYEVVITSVNDGQHMEGSRHYKNCALDIRTRGMGAETVKKIVTDLQHTMGSDFDVLAGEGYIHIEYDPN